MIEVCRLTKRQIDPSSKKMPKELEQVKIFSMSVGHGIGNVDYVECVGKIEESEYESMLQHCDEYAQFKLGNLSKYFEIEVFPEHAQILSRSMPDGFLKELFKTLKEGYVVIRKSV